MVVLVRLYSKPDSEARASLLRCTRTGPAFDQALFHHAEQVAAAAHRILPTRFLQLPGELNRVFQVARIHIGKGLHASTPRILSRVIGKSRTRFPMAL
jgi:hypothetical protein